LKISKISKWKLKIKRQSDLCYRNESKNHQRSLVCLSVSLSVCLSLTLSNSLSLSLPHRWRHGNKNKTWKQYWRIGTSTVVFLFFSSFSSAQIPSFKHLQTFRNHQGRWMVIVSSFSVGLSVFLSFFLPPRVSVCWVWIEHNWSTQQ